MMKPGEYLIESEDIIANEGRATITITVSNRADRPIQVGSHFHFFEVNRGLSFDREKAFGMRLNIPSGTAVRFEPGQSHEVELTEYGGTKVVFGFNGLTNGRITDSAVKEAALNKMKEFLEKSDKGNQA